MSILSLFAKRTAKHPRTALGPLLALLAAISATVPAAEARAEDAASTHEAAKHFQRGVSLYGEADYRAALVEFKRAYAIAPNIAVLYNVGETQFQLQDYAAALTTFDRFLAESSPTESHRAEVDGNIEILRSRVGHLIVTSAPTGADITVDDQPVGKTPLDRPLLVSIGRRKVVATVPGRPSVSRYVEVAADDNVTVALPLPAPPEADTTASAAWPPDAPHESHLGTTLRVAGWIGTALLAGGAGVFGYLATDESNQLQKDRATFPVAAGTLAHASNLTMTYAIAADSLAAAAVVLGGVTLVSTIASHSAGSPARGAAREVRVGLGPTSARFEMTF